jgi:ribosomal 50S subunit-associated protein YjgA (DUF615 family)
MLCFCRALLLPRRHARDTHLAHLASRGQSSASVNNVDLLSCTVVRSITPWRTRTKEAREREVAAAILHYPKSDIDVVLRSTKQEEAATKPPSHQRREDVP